MTTQPVLGVDFGATKTYLSKCPGDDPSPTSVDFGDGRDGIPSAILYRKEKEPIIGQIALDEYGEATAWERASFRLVTNFKADLARSEEAHAAAADFLSTLLADARKQRLDVEPSTRRVLFGIPSEADDAFRAALEATAERAGFGVPFLVDEPKGALLYHMKQRDISVDKALDGVLVADFGGGTCDFAFLEGGRVVRSWGDMLLGGRLFDDLFFQWLCDLNPGLDAELEAQGSAYFVQSHLCREVKEFFSRSMARDRGEPVSKVLAGYGRLTDITWEEFLRRGASYSPSRAFIECSKGILPELRGRAHSTAWNFLAHDATGPLQGQKIDLFGWFRTCLRSGLEEGAIDRERISLVILAGGSSLWPFVGEILREEIPLREECSLVRSDRPYAVIAQGISLLPALKKRFARTRQSLQDEFPHFLENRLGALTANRVAALEEKMASLAVDIFFRKEIVPLLEEFRKQGGSLLLLRKRIDERTSSAEPLAREHLARLAPRFLEGLREEIRELLAEWFASHGVVLPKKDLSFVLPDELSEPMLRVRIPAADGMLDVVGTAVGGLLTAGAAMLCGGSSTALIAAGPIGFAAGAILGASAGWILFRYGRARLRETAERMELPPFIAAFMIDEKRIEDLQNDLSDALAAHLERRFVPLKRELDERIRTLVRDEIRALNEINSF